MASAQVDRASVRGRCHLDGVSRLTEVENADGTYTVTAGVRKVEDGKRWLVRLIVSGTDTIRQTSARPVAVRGGWQVTKTFDSVDTPSFSMTALAPQATLDKGQSCRLGVQPTGPAGDVSNCRGSLELSMTMHATTSGGLVVHWLLANASPRSGMVVQVESEGASSASGVATHATAPRDGSMRGRATFHDGPSARITLSALATGSALRSVDAPALHRVGARAWRRRTQESAEEVLSEPRRVRRNDLMTA